MSDALSLAPTAPQQPSIFDLLNGTATGGAATNPGMMGLVGLAGGFARAAMPQPYKGGTPFGAALGMAAEGMGEGQRQAYQTQLAQQQARAAQLANLRTQTFLGGMQPIVSRLNGGQGASAAAPSGSAQSASSAGTPAPSGGGNSPYLTDPQTLSDLGMLAMYSGQDRAAAQLFGMPNQMAGGAGYAMAPNGTAFAVPGGAKDPRTIYTTSNAEAAGKVAPTLQTTLGQKQIDLGYAGPIAAATAGGTASGTAPYQPPITVTAPGPGGVPTTYQVPVPAWAARNGEGGAAAANGAIPAPVYAQRIQQYESSGNPDLTNPNSTAAGPSQFLNQTWLPLARQVLPQAQGMTDDQVLALRKDPAISQQMTLEYARRNAPVLQAAGIPPTAQTLALAHRFGPDGATTILHSDPALPLSRVLPPNVIQANPQLANQTVGALVGATGLRYGFAPVDFGNGATPSSIPGAIQGKPEMTPEQEGVSKEYGIAAGKITAAGLQAPVTLQRLDIIDNATQAFRPGTSAPIRLAAGKAFADVLQGMGVTPPDWVVNGAAGGETIGKEGGFLAAEMTRALGSREAASVFNQVRGIQPNIQMSQGGFQVVTNSLRQGALRDQDLNNFQEQWLADPSHRGSIAGMSQAFEQTHPVEAYASRVVPYPIPPSWKPGTTTGLKPGVIYRSPDGRPAMFDGKNMLLIPGG